MLWVHEDCRMQGLGQQMLEAAEAVARERGCHQILVSSFTFQAPAFHTRNGVNLYCETHATALPGVEQEDAWRPPGLLQPPPATRSIHSTSRQ